MPHRAQRTCRSVSRRLMMVAGGSAMADATNNARDFTWWRPGPYGEALASAFGGSHRGRDRSQADRQAHREFGA